MPDPKDCVACENQCEEAVAMLEESPFDVGINLNKLGTYFSSLSI